MVNPSQQFAVTSLSAPGQHATFRFTIDGAWVERTYSLSGVAPAQGASRTGYRLSVRSSLHSDGMPKHIPAYS